MGKAESELKKISAIIQAANDKLDTDPKTDKGIDRAYFNDWGKRYVRTHRAITNALDNLTGVSEDGKSPVINPEMLDAFHANLARLRQAVEVTKDTKKNLFPDKKKDKEFKEYSKDFFPKIKEIQTSFAKNPYLQDDVQSAEGTSPQELVDVSNRLLNKLNYIYTQTDAGSINGGNALDPLPKRTRGQGGIIGKQLDDMQAILGVLHEEEKDVPKNGLIKDNPVLIGQQLKQFKEGLNVLQIKIKNLSDSIKKLPDDSVEEALLVEAEIMKNEVDAFEKRFGKEFEKRIKVYEDALKIPQVKMQGPDNASLYDVRDQLRAAGVGGAQNVDGLPTSSTPGGKGRSNGGVSAA